MKSAWGLGKKFLFSVDAERAHSWVVQAILATYRLGGPSALRIFAGINEAHGFTPPIRVLGTEFCSPVGLAAGFDKGGDLLEALPHLGFGFAEVGTVTPLPQPGNPKPRLFRDASNDSLFNRMGFNGEGAIRVAQRVREAKKHLPSDFRVGINVGMNKATPLELAASDYGLAASYFEDLADYLVINVSSPNTPGLRSLQNEESLRKIISEVQNTIGNWSRVPPVLLKLAPEVQDEPLSKIFELGTQVGISGWVLTNTLGGAWIDSIPGGWSGKILTEASRASLRAAVSQTKLPIISVGGIMTPTEANDRLKSGASLIQIYSGWIFSGPRFPNEINEFLKNQLK